MIWIFVVLAAAGVFVVAAVAVGRESFRLGHQLPASIFDLDAAVESTADALPEAVQARIGYDDVRVIVEGYVDHLQDRGIVGRYGRDPTIVVHDGPEADVVVADEDTLAVVLGRMDDQALEVTDEDAATVIAALHGYLADIGALGPQAADPIV